MAEHDVKILKTDFPDKEWKYLTKNLAYLYEHFKSIDDYQKPDDNSKKEDFFSKLKDRCPDDEGKERTKEINKLFNIKSGEDLTQL